MNPLPLQNGPKNLIGPNSQASSSGSMAVKRPRIEITSRSNPTSVKSTKLTNWDRPGAHRNTGAKVTGRFVSALRKWRLLEENNLLFKYEAIGPTELRLLTLQPAPQHEDDIHVSLDVYPDDETGSEEFQQAYEALSYHWGPGPAVQPVYVDNQKPGGKVEFADLPSLHSHVPDLDKGPRFYVRSNLDKALRYLRYKDRKVVLWVDAICINQQDEKVEKPAQIAKMKRIYNRANNVCIWLGDGKGAIEGDRSGDFYAAMEFSQNILDLAKFKTLLHESHTKSWSDLLDLIRCSWFSRRWVIQELALAREATVHLGAKYVPWQDFADAIGQSHDMNVYRNYENFHELEPLGAKVLVDAVTNVFRKNADGTVFEPVSSLETLVSNLAFFESSDPRDSIFALLNIARESALPTQDNRVGPPKPDYEKNLLEVYTDLLEWVVCSTASLDIMCRQWATPERTAPAGRKNATSLVTLPSWIQTIDTSTWGARDQRFNGRLNGDSLVGKAERRRYIPQVKFGERRMIEGGSISRVNSPSGTINPQASLTASPTMATFPNGNRASPSTTASHINLSHRLYVKGVMIGSIGWTSDPIVRGVIPRACLIKGGWKFDGAPKVIVPDKLWRTMVADRDAEGNNTPPWYHRAALHSMTLVDNNGNLPTQELLMSDDIKGGNRPQIVTEFLKRVQGVVWNRRFLEGIWGTSNGSSEPLFGIGPPRAELGDMICILFGCSVPCILRSCGAENNQGCYELIGEAYIYGRMDGEGVLMLSARELQDKTEQFVIV
ncbi:heterokaryon incompatibility protein-domain-containing protein [Nemania sp. NC0429]|nr:heterokaryon incompatibility protein-domain-containing protein [Nemania sp. NC0429]